MGSKCNNRTVRHICKMVSLITLVTLIQTLSLTAADHLVLRELNDYPLALCNDGSPATYHYTEGDLNNPNMLIYLQGGGACVGLEDCENRCTASEFRCTAETSPTLDMNTTFWSQDLEVNPPFHDFGKVYVHYCSSDIWSGTREGSDNTNGYHFYGRHIVDAVVTDIIKHKPNIENVARIVFIGTSAGAFGVNSNCDFVAEKFHNVNPNIDFRCISDSADFYPAWVHVENCDPYQISNMAREFWQTKGDESCEEEVPEGSLECNIFPSYYNFIETPLMVIGRYIDKTVHGPCTPALDEDPAFWEVWQQEAYSMALQFIEDKPFNGLFMLNCPGHVLANGDFGWDKVEVPEVKGEEMLQLRNVVENWLSGDSGPYQAMDLPLQENPKCHHH